MYHPPLVGKFTIASDEGISSDGLSENFHAQDVGDDVLRFSVDVRVDEGDVVVAAYAVSKSAVRVVSVV
jgi:hypothetical protein